MLYSLLEDVLRLVHGVDRAYGMMTYEADLEALAATVSFDGCGRRWQRVDELVELARRNIQKSLALDALLSELRSR